MFARQVLKTNFYHRPFPSLVFIPGLNTQPFHDKKKFAFVNDLEGNTESIRKEYMALKQAYGDRDDYKQSEKEH